MENIPETKAVVHKPVLTREVIEYLAVKPGGVYLDVTFGAGGHTRAILQSDATCKVIAMDWDTRSIDTYAPALQQEFPDRFTIIWGNFAHIYKLLKKAKINAVDGILADFGTSQMQIFERAGFSFLRNSPLDMRMSPPHQKVTAAEVVNTASPALLRTIIGEHGQERFVLQIVRAIVAERAIRPITTTLHLAQLIQKAVPSFSKKRKIHPATQTFQALRVYVNHELDNINAFLPVAVQVLNPGGRLVCISFHSLEDRMVKDFFRQQQELGRGKVITKKVITAQDDELAINPSSRSAKLRALEVIHHE
jgi:16S rRNA (cytosine1402-N4)-methyltransferase